MFNGAIARSSQTDVNEALQTSDIATNSDIYSITQTLNQKIAAVARNAIDSIGKSTGNSYSQSLDWNSTTPQVQDLSESISSSITVALGIFLGGLLIISISYIASRRKQIFDCECAREKPSHEELAAIANPKSLHSSHSVPGNQVYISVWMSHSNCSINDMV